MMNSGLGLLFILITYLVFLSMRYVYNRFRMPLFNPVATTTLFIIIGLLLTDISYDTYMLGGWWIQELLGPAVVALAYPLYHQRAKILRYRISLLAGISSGIVVGMISGFIYVKVANLPSIYSSSFLPKSVTSPIAMEIADLTGGIPSLAAALVIVSGIFGALFGPILMRLLGITHYLGVGVGFGCAAHGIGTAKAMEYGEEEAAFSSISMTLSAILYALILPVAIHYLL